MEGGAPEITVIIPVRNGASVLARQLSALVEQDSQVPFEVVVADNGSDDETARIAADYSDRLSLRVIDASAVTGASAARNEGARHARADRLAFLDADDVAGPGWLSALRRAQEKHPSAVLLGRLDFSAANDPAVLRAYRYITDDPPAADVQSEAPREVDPAERTLPGGNFSLSRDTWLELGGMREDFPYGAEDLDLGLRASDAGHSVVFVPDAVVHCSLRDTSAGIFRQQRQWSRARVLLAEQDPMHRLGSPSVRASASLLVRSVARAIPESLGRRDLRPLANDLGISLGRLEGAVTARRVRQTTP